MPSHPYRGSYAPLWFSLASFVLTLILFGFSLALVFGGTPVAHATGETPGQAVFFKVNGSELQSSGVATDDRLWYFGWTGWCVWDTSRLDGTPPK